MNPPDRPDYSTLEVSDGNLPQARWQDASNLPEVSQATGRVDAEKLLADKLPAENRVAAPVTSTASRTICGLRRSTFWIVIVVVLVIIIAAAVGGGVGGAEAAKSKSSATTPMSSSSTTLSSSSTTLSSSAPTASPTGLLANSALASLNYTDQNNVDHVRVYYQVASNAIYQSAWNSSGKSWIVIPVTTAGAINNVNTDIDVLPQTPISANIYWHSSSEIDFHVYYLNSASALQELFILGPASGDGPWSQSGLDGQYFLSASSRMTSYGRACANCFDASMIVYEGTGNDVKLIQLVNTFQQSSIGAYLPTPVAGSAFAIIPGAGNTEAIALYMNGVNLDEIYYNGSDWNWTQKLPNILSSAATIGAFAYGINGTTSGSNGIEILYTNSSSFSSNASLTPAGLSIMSWNSTDRNWRGPSAPSSFAQVTSSSGLAANLAGKVYAIVAGNRTSGGSGRNSESEYSLMEWQFTGTQGSYTLVGQVTTL